MAVINGVFTVLGGVMIFVMGLSSLTGNNLAKKVPFLMLFPTIWSAARLIITFLSYTTISVNAIDMSDLVYMVFTTLFLYNASMLYIGLKSKNPVKACFLYGPSRGSGRICLYGRVGFVCGSQRTTGAFSFQYKDI